MKINYQKVNISLMYGNKLPRKVKKHVLGKRMSNAALNRLLKTVKVIKSAKTMYESPVILPYLFCPHCGCTLSVGSGNKTEYPEHWEDFKCGRCRKIVAYIDNSPFIHALEHPECKYDPTF